MKATTLKGSLSLILALLMTLGVLLTAVSCGETTEDPAAQTQKQDGTGTEEIETEEREAYATVEKENFDREFIFLTRSDNKEQFYVEEYTGDLLDDLIYERNTVVSTDFGVEFVYYDLDYMAVNDTMRLQVTSGLDDYDVYTGHKYSFTSCAQNNYCYNLGEIASMDLTGEWWDQGCYENLTIDDKTYVITGDIDPDSMLISACMVFNKKMMTELGKNVDELNELTDNGGWTLDVMYEYGKDVTRDLNGDGKIEYGSDRFNLSSWMMDVPFSLYYGANGNFVTIVDGTPELTYTAEQVTNIYDKIYKIIIEQNAYFVTDLSQYATTYDVFTEGRAMFVDMCLSKITTFLSEMDDPYGILPIPKYDTNQKEYLSFVNGATPFVMVGKTESDPEFVGTILEAMATYNYDNITPQLFEVATKLQAAQDPASAAMVDYIVRNRIWDLGYYADWAITNVVLENLKKGSDSIASALDSQGKAASRGLKILLNSYAKHK
ncbi:MAG: hypothetical protein IJA91_03690 [Clostridia bacterium]|nr:hypothetical protein [Clostridia bacterium]